MRLGFNQLKPVIYFAEDSTGKRICNDFSIRLTKFGNLPEKIKEVAEKCRNSSHLNMLHKGDSQDFVDCHRFSLIVGESLRETINYETYLKLDEYDKDRFARRVSKIILISEAENLWLSSKAIQRDDDDYDDVYIPMVSIHLRKSMTKNEVSSLLEQELKDKESKLSKLGILRK